MLALRLRRLEFAIPFHRAGLKRVEQNIVQRSALNSGRCPASDMQIMEDRLFGGAAEVSLARYVREMHRSKHSLHHPVALADPQKAAMTQLQAALHRQKRVDSTAAAEAPGPAGKAVSHVFPITTVAMNLNFDAYILVGFKGVEASASHLLVDSGNTSLVMPRWEEIEGISGYQVLGQATEPWGCPANVVRGPIQLFDEAGELFTIEDCVFFACTGDSPVHHHRTANFGVGCVVPWTACPANVLPGLGITLQPVLSQTEYRYVEFDYAPWDPAQVAHPAGTASFDSAIRLHAALPAGFSMFRVLRDCPWMSLRPTGLTIAGAPTEWPGALTNPIAMIDTGGGPVYLSDPRDYLCSSEWPEPVDNPAWVASAMSAKSIEAPLEITLGDETGTYSYVVDGATFPAAARGLTLVMSEQDSFMRGYQGMNAGGISALAHAILIDYQDGKMGFRKR